MASSGVLANLFIDISLRGGQDALRKQSLIMKEIKNLRSPISADLAAIAVQNKKLTTQRDELINYRLMVAEHGKLSAALSTVHDKLKGIGAAAGAAYFAMDAAILGVVAAASPDVFQTFTGSLKLLSAEIGTIFLPLVIQTAYWIQQASHYVRELTPETREQVLTWAKWGLILTGATFALVKLVAVGKSLSMAFAWMSSFNFAALLNPFVLGAIAATAAIAGLAYALYHLSTQHTSAIAANTAITHRLDQGGDMSMDDFNQLDPRIRQRYLGTNSRSARRQILDDELARNQQQQAANAPAAASAPFNQATSQANTQATSAVSGPMFGWLNRLFGGIQAQQAIAPAAEQSRLAAESARLRALRDRGVASGGGPGGPDFASTHTAQFTSFEQGWKRIQQEAASRGPVEERMMAIQEESRNYLRDIRGNTARPGQTYFDLNAGTID